MHDPFQTHLDVELDVRKLGQTVRDRQPETTCHQRRAIADRNSAMQAVADSAVSGSQVVDVGYDPARLLGEDSAVPCDLGTAHGPLEQLDPEAQIGLISYGLARATGRCFADTLRQDGPLIRTMQARTNPAEQQGFPKPSHFLRSRTLV